MPLVDNLLRTIPQSLRESEYTYLANTGGDGMMQQEIKVHQDIVDAVAAGDCPAAEAAMEAHMAFEEELIRRTFSLQEDAV